MSSPLLLYENSWDDWVQMYRLWCTRVNWNTMCNIRLGLVVWSLKNIHTMCGLHVLILSDNHEAFPQHNFLYNIDEHFFFADWKLTKYTFMIYIAVQKTSVFQPSWKGLWDQLLQVHSSDCKKASKISKAITTVWQH